MPSTTAQGRFATEAKSGGVRVRPMQNMMMPSRYGTLGASGLKAPGRRKPATPAATTRSGKTVTAMRAIFASAARAGLTGASASVRDSGDLVASSIQAWCHQCLRCGHFMTKGRTSMSDLWLQAPASGGSLAQHRDELVRLAQVAGHLGTLVLGPFQEFGQPGGGVGGCRRSGVLRFEQAEDFGHLLEGEPQRFYLFDQHQARRVGFGIDAEPALGAGRRGQQPDVVVMADGPQRESGAFCQFTDMHGVG